MTVKLTPMLQQYMSAKRDHPDVLLMSRMGDFYEMFGEDAKVAARELEITLTSREAGEMGRIAMCGVPHHSVEKYIARLIAKGYRVAVCDQMENPKLAKGLVKRAVTRVVTPGTVLEDSMLEPKSNNYLASVTRKGELFGLSVLDVSTGEFLVTEVSGRGSEKRLLDEIGRLSPAELLVPPDYDALFGRMAEIGNARATEYALDRFASPREVLVKHFDTASLRGFGCEDFTLGVEAAATVLKYIESTQSAALQHIRTLTTYSTSGFMVLDAPARRNLELTQSMYDGSKSKSLIQILDRTCTPMGGRLLRKWIDQPLLDVAAINQRLEAVDEVYGNLIIRSKVRELLSRIYDLERLTTRTVTGTASARDLISLRNSLVSLPELERTLAAFENETMRELNLDLGSLDGIALLITSAISEEPPITLRDGGLIKPGFHDDLDKLRSASKDGKGWIAALEAQERERTGIKTLKVGFNSVFGYYIEVSKANSSLVPEDYIRKQTTVNGERFITPQLKEYESLVLGAEEKSTQLEYEIFCAVRQQVADESARLMKAAHAIAHIDVLCSLAEVASTNRYVKPTVDDGTEILIKNGRHPVVEELQTGEFFVPNDAQLDCDQNQLLVITGPNMAGKSTYLRQVALVVLLAQVGSFVPAESARVGVVDRIFTRVGAHDELYSGQSTFMVEMTETANILNNATDRSLIILDEIGRGTSTYDGLSIAWAVAEYIKTIKAKTLFATHYHHLNELEKSFPGIKNYRIAVKEDPEKIIWLRKIVPGGTDRSYGIQVARLAGLPEAVIERAKEVLWQLESNNNAHKDTIQPNAKVSTKTKKIQLTLFEAESDPVLMEIGDLDVSTMTPIEALTKLYELQDKIKRGRR